MKITPESANSSTETETETETETVHENNDLQLRLDNVRLLTQLPNAPSILRRSAVFRSKPVGYLRAAPSAELLELSPAQRAAKIVGNNRFVTLAFIDDDGPWAVPVNYILMPDQSLLFYSAKTSRHARATGKCCKVSGAIYDSRASSEEVDGIQFGAVCREVNGEELVESHSHYFEYNFDASSREWWYRPVQAFMGEGVSRFYKVEFDRVFVIDFEAINANRVDSRLLVDRAELADLLGAQIHKKVS